MPDTLLMSKYSWGASIILEAADRLEELNKYEHSLTDDLNAAYDTIRGLEFELEKCQMSAKSDTKSAERPINKTLWRDRWGLRVAMYAAKLDERVEELENENAKLKAEIDEVLCVCEGPSTLQELRIGFINGISYRTEAEMLRKENAELRAAIDAARKEQP